jgi:hypothetical protein
MGTIKSWPKTVTSPDAQKGQRIPRKAEVANAYSTLGLYNSEIKTELVMKPEDATPLTNKTHLCKSRESVNKKDL